MSRRCPVCLDGLITNPRAFPFPTTVDCGACPLGQLRSALAAKQFTLASRIHGQIRQRRDDLWASLCNLDDVGATLAERERRTERYEEAQAELVLAGELIGHEFQASRPPATAPVNTTAPVSSCRSHPPQLHVVPKE